MKARFYLKGAFTPNYVYENFIVGTSVSHLRVYKVVKSDMVLLVKSSIYYSKIRIELLFFSPVSMSLFLYN